MSPYIAQLTLPPLDESKRCASFYDLQARSFRAEKLTWLTSRLVGQVMNPKRRYGFKQYTSSLGIYPHRIIFIDSFLEELYSSLYLCQSLRHKVNDKTSP